MGLYVKTDNSGQEIKPKDGQHYSLEEMQAYVGGIIELVWLENENILVCDEEGRCKGKGVNVIATQMANFLGYRGLPIVGDVIFVKDGEIE